MDDQVMPDENPVLLEHLLDILMLMGAYVDIPREQLEPVPVRVIVNLCKTNPLAYLAALRLLQEDGLIEHESLERGREVYKINWARMDERKYEEDEP